MSNQTPSPAVAVSTGPKAPTSSERKITPVYLYQQMCALDDLCIQYPALNKFLSAVLFGPESQELSDANEAEQLFEALITDFRSMCELATEVQFLDPSVRCKINRFNVNGAHFVEAMFGKDTQIVKTLRASRKAAR